MICVDDDESWLKDSLNPLHRTYLPDFKRRSPMPWHGVLMTIFSLGNDHDFAVRATRGRTLDEAGALLTASGRWRLSHVTSDEVHLLSTGGKTRAVLSVVD